jgi:ribokinase
MDAVGMGALNVDLLYEMSDYQLEEMGLTPGAERLGDGSAFSEVFQHLETDARLVTKSGGGSAANAIYAMSRMGLTTGLLGAVGNDAYGDFVLSSLEGVDTSRVKRIDGTGMCISVIAAQDRSLLVLPNANDRLYLDEGDLDYLNGSRIVHLTSFVSDRVLEIQKRIVRELESGVMISLDPGELYAHRSLRALKPLLSRCQVFLPSDREVHTLTGLDCLEGSRELLTLGPEIVVCKMGEKGSLIVTAEEEIRIQARGARAVDKTGAGDVYAAGFLTGMLKGWTLRKCGEFASKLAARSIEYYGREGYPEREDLEGYSER